MNTLDRLDTGDCLTLLPKLPSGCAHLVFADPPFNIGYEYDTHRDDMTPSDYLKWANRWLAECVRVLHPHGSLFLAIGDEYVADYKLRLDSFGLTMRNWIIWHYTFGPHQKKKFGRDHAHILYYVRDPENFTFNASAVMVESERQRSGDARANPEGRVPGDVWSFPRIVGNAKERNTFGHKAQMPEAVLDRIIRVASNAGELVVDPFGGSGTTLAVAKRLGRQWYGCELSEAYAAGARARIDAVKPNGAAA